MEYANKYPWTWSASDLDDWRTELTAAGGRDESTICNYQGSIRQFCDYITSLYYQWPEICEERFGTHPIQFCPEWSTVREL